MKIKTILGASILLFSSISYAAPINFSGQLDIIDIDTGGGVYAGLSIGTNFSGSIDDVSVNGIITDGTTATFFGCCIAAGGLSVSNDITLDADDAAYLNTLLGYSLFNSGDVVDGIDIEGDATTDGGGRIEIGLSYIFAGDTFTDESPGNYPFDPDDVLLSLFFIAEEDSFGEDIYSAVGQLDSVPVPGPAPACDIQMNQLTYFDGDTVIADVFRIANLSATAQAVELKVWRGLPEMPPISIYNVGADGSFVLPAGMDVDLGPVPFFQVTADWPSGTYELSCRLLDPVTGGLLSEDLNNFDIREGSIYEIGQTGPAGGIVFYISDGGSHGFEAAPADLANAEWGCVGTDLPGADGTGIGTGAPNTAAIIAGCPEPEIAARLADAYMLNGFSDWFLPSKDELNEIYLNRAVVDGLCMQGTCAVYFYWGSTEVNTNQSSGQRIGDDGFQNNVGKNASFAVRPIRAF